MYVYIYVYTHTDHTKADVMASHICSFISFCCGLNVCLPKIHMLKPTPLR